MSRICLSVLLVGLVAVNGEPIRLGEFTTYHHDVSGEVFVVDESHIRIKNFNYDGAGPDAFFWVGWDGTPSSNDETKTAILAYPFKDKNYVYRDESAPVLSASDNEDVYLTLPPEIKASELKWISVWCRKFAVNFGDLVFQEGIINFSEGESSDDLPPPRVPPTSTTTSTEAPHHDDEDAYAEPEPEAEYDDSHHHDDDGAYAEPESESEPESEPESNDIDHGPKYPPKSSPRSGAESHHLSQLFMAFVALVAIMH